MTAPTIAVTCVANDQNGNPVAGAVFTARLDSTEVYQGFVVPERVQVVANASGIAVLNLWPNALGVAGSLYRVTAVNPDTGRKFLDTTISVPNSPCSLHEILVQGPYPTLDAAAQALVAAQGALAEVTALVFDAADSQAAAAASEAAAEADRVAALGSQMAAANSAAEAAYSAGRIDLGALDNAVTVSTAQAVSATASAVEATTQRNAASVSAAAALASQGVTTTKAAEGATSAAAALASENTATTQATASAASAATSLAQANISTTKAGEAAASATASDTARAASVVAKDAAVVAKTAAETANGTAQTAATTATTQAGISTTGATAATTAKDLAQAAQAAAEAARDGATAVMSGGAGGVLSGSYPNPSFAVDMATQAELDNKVSKTGDTMTGGLTVGGNLGLAGNPGFNRVIGPTAGTNTTLVLEGSSSTGSSANIGLTNDNLIYLDATQARFRSQDASVGFLNISSGATNVLTGALQQQGNQVLHAGNYTSYSPSLTGSGASGSWGISITGNAATVTNGVYTAGDQTISGVKTFLQPLSGHITTSSGTFRKADPYTVVFTKTGASTINIKAGTVVDVSGTPITFTNTTAITMPTLVAGNDYAIWCKPNGSLEATSNHTSPPVANSRKIGGFHYAPGGHSGSPGGGNTTPGIWAGSFWDLKFRPACPDPRGMEYFAGSWMDMYFTGVDAITNGSSKYNVTIADGSSPPKVPTMFGGNGSTTYGSYTWFEAMELATAFGKRCPTQQEFMAHAYGTTEESSIGTDQVSTVLNATYTSAAGLFQATGVMWIWARDRGGPSAAASWNANTEGRGSEYNAPNAALLGGTWTDGSDSGSRCSFWSVAASASINNIGSRFCCDHLQLD